MPGSGFGLAGGLMPVLLVGGVLVSERAVGTPWVANIVCGRPVLGARNGRLRHSLPTVGLGSNQEDELGVEGDGQPPGILHARLEAYAP